MRKALFLTLIAASMPALAQTGLSIDWEWKVAHRCDNTSPALTVSGLPKNTKSLSVNMVDLDFRMKDHGGGVVAHAGGATAAVPEGALTSSYLGPCPNNYSSFGHNYQITVRALSADGTELSIGTMAKEFSAKTAK
jgi:phosphatidylethanolamine-binding protein (PEBP) family uncharacterized protein